MVTGVFELVLLVSMVTGIFYFVADRVGSEFWSQPAQIGNNTTGIR